MTTATAAFARRSMTHWSRTPRSPALLGGPKVYDEPPASAAFPYVTLGEARVGDFSAGDEHAARSISSRCMPGRGRADTRRRT